ncbi:MAG: protease inhibitor I42 family protein [Butyrivibrio sp.]|nr:protease inhibitor I42 family protein [Butyrivibrio sp.]
MNKTAVILMGLAMCVVMTGCQKNESLDKFAVNSATAQSGVVASAESDNLGDSDKAFVNNSGESMTQNGKTLKVVYESNPTTGYSWEISISDPKVIKCVSDVYREDKNAGGNSATDEVICGRGGYETFVFEGIGKGAAVITFNYAQQWKGGNKGESRTVKVETDDQGNIISVK